MKKGAVIGIIAVVVIVGIFGAAMMSGSNNSDDSGDSKKTYQGECTYKLEQVNAYPYSIGGTMFVKVADPGMKLIKVTGTLTNNQDKCTMSNNPYNFKFICDGLSYNYEVYNYNSVDIGKGYSASIDLCFMVPESGAEMELKWDGILIKDVNMIKQ